MPILMLDGVPIAEIDGKAAEDLLFLARGGLGYLDSPILLSQLTRPQTYRPKISDGPIIATTHQRVKVEIQLTFEERIDREEFVRNAQVIS